MRAAARRRTGCATPAAARWLPLLFSAASASTLTLCEDAASCGLVENMCGSTTDTLIQRNARVIVCVGFEAEGNEDPAAVTKAVFQVRVDKYSELKISSCARPRPSPTARAAATRLVPHRVHPSPFPARPVRSAHDDGVAELERQEGALHRIRRGARAAHHRAAPGHGARDDG
jgi:hypothetical protein